MTKRCPDCGDIKPLEDFPPQKKRRDGRGLYCRPCMNKRSTASRYTTRAAEGRPVNPRRRSLDGHRWCPDCQQEKPLDQFPRNRSGRLGHGRYCLPCHNTRTRANVEKNHGSTRNFHLMRRYGITQDDVDRMLAAQGGVCATCGTPDPGHVDHDHKTGVVRGMLCFNCNQALGNVRDDARTRQKMVRYLATSRKAPLELISEEYRPRRAAPTPDPGSVVEVAFAAAMAA